MTVILACLWLLTAFGTAGAEELKDGDIVFQISRSAQSSAIQKATRSKYSHMGMILYRNGYPQVFEAGATVRYTPLQEWINQGNGNHYAVKRLRNAAAVLTGESLSKLRREAENFKGKPYDPFFEWSDQRIYCSELVWKIYRNTLGIELGKTQPRRAFDLTSPLVRKQLAKRYGRKIPYDEPMISPAAIYRSRHLITVNTD